MNNEPTQSKRIGFTLVELLVAMSVMSILVSMVMAAMTSAQQDARRARAENQINRINNIVAEIFERESHRRFSLGPPDPGFSFFKDNTATHRMQVFRRLNEARLKLVRDWLRITMPDRRADFLSTPINVYVRTYQFSDTSVIVDKLVHNPHNPPADKNLRSTRQERLFARVGALIGAHAQKNNLTVPTDDADAVNNFWSDANQDAECLYLVLKSHSIAGSLAIEAIRKSEIGDTDNDGVPEILDPWGQPVGFIRWPAGYWLTYPSRMETDPATRVNVLEQRRSELGPDGTDLLRVDYRYFQSGLKDDPYNISPIVFSAGEDGVFDMVTRWRASAAGVPSQLSYGTMPYPSSPAGFCPDPYLVNYFTAGTINEVDYESITDPFSATLLNGLVGAYLDENQDEDDNSTDNVFPQS